MTDTTRPLGELIQAIEGERAARVRDLEKAVNGDSAFVDLLGLFKDTIIQDINFLHELAVHVAALEGEK